MEICWIWCTEYLLRCSWGVDSKTNGVSWTLASPTFLRWNSSPEVGIEFGNVDLTGETFAVADRRSSWRKGEVLADLFRFLLLECRLLMFWRRSIAAKGSRVSTRLESAAVLTNLPFSSRKRVYRVDAVVGELGEAWVGA